MRGRLVKRSPGSWTIVLDGTPDPMTGKRRQVNRTVRGSKREAERILVELLTQRDRGAGIRPERLSVGDYLTEWCDDLPVTVRPATAHRYRGLLTRHVIPHLGQVQLTRLTPAEVNALLAERLASGLAPQSVAHIRAVLRKALNDAIRVDLAWRNAAALATPPRVSSPTRSPMTPDEAQAILAATATTRIGPVVATALYTGLRQGEVLGLRWADVDLEQGQLRVAWALQRLERRFCLVEPKSATSRRAVPLPPPLIPILRAHRTAQLEARLSVGAAWIEMIPGLIFTTALGKPLEGPVVTREFQATCRRANLTRRRFHDLRHGAATLLLAAGVDLKTISTLLGHSTITLTANTYAGVVPALAEDAMNRLGTLLSPPGSGAL